PPQPLRPPPERVGAFVTNWPPQNDSRLTLPSHVDLPRWSDAHHVPFAHVEAFKQGRRYRQVLAHPPGRLAAGHDDLAARRLLLQRVADLLDLLALCLHVDVEALEAERHGQDGNHLC